MQLEEGRSSRGYQDPGCALMSRYTGPRVKVMRALGVNLPGLSTKSWERRPYPPGQHGQARRKLSEFAVRLIEKQKLRMNYGLGERQLRRLVLEARRSRVATAKLLELLERRLDNAVFRSEFARTIPAARQLVNHGHVLVNGKRVDIPSYRIRVGDVIALRDPSRPIPDSRLGAPGWLAVDRDRREARVTTLPDSTSVLFPLSAQLVIEFYSQRV